MINESFRIKKELLDQIRKHVLKIKLIGGTETIASWIEDACKQKMKSPDQWKYDLSYLIEMEDVEGIMEFMNFSREDAEAEIAAYNKQFT